MGIRTASFAGVLALSIAVAPMAYAVDEPMPGPVVNCRAIDPVPGADLTGARLTGANLTGAKLRADVAEWLSCTADRSCFSG